MVIDLHCLISGVVHIPTKNLIQVGSTVPMTCSYSIATTYVVNAQLLGFYETDLMHSLAPRIVKQKNNLFEMQ